MGFVECGVDRLIHGRLIRAIEDDGERRAHGIGASSDPLRLRRWGQQKRSEEREKTTHQDCPWPFGICPFQNDSYSNIASLIGMPRTSILLRSAEPIPAASPSSIMLSAYWNVSSPGCN